MDTSEILKRVKKIELKSRRKASNLFLGEYQSSFKGRGMIFSEIRPYQYGDDVRNIDWNKTAYLSEPYVKVFEEEREMTMILLVDISSSENFGTRKQLKKETIAEICATLAISATTYNDKVGLVLYSDNIELMIPPKKGKKHILRLIKTLLTFEPKSKGTNLSIALEYVMKTFKRKTNLFILSDFIDASDYNKAVKITAKKHDINAIRIYDEKESFIPNIGLVHIKDSETGEIKLIDTSSEKVRRQYREYYSKLENRFQLIFSQAGATATSIKTDQDYFLPLLQLFQNKKSLV